MPSPRPSRSGGRVRAELAHVARSLASLGPARGRRWPLALQAALAMAVPIVVLAASGNEHVALLAATGAFAVTYGGWLRPRERARVTPVLALAFWIAAAAGTFAAGGGTAAVLAGVLVMTVVAAALAAAVSLGPPGPVFFVLVFGLSAQVTAIRGGERVVDPGQYLLIVAASGVFACLVAVCPLVLRRHRHEVARPLRTLFPPRWSALAGTLTIRAAIVAVGGVAAAVVVDPTRSYWIVCAGLAVVGLPVGRRDAATRGIHRSVGTVIGGALYLALAFVPLPVWALGILLGALQFAIELVVVRHYALALVFITPLVLLLIGAAAGEAAGVAQTLPLAVERIIDTVVGAAVGTAAALVVRMPVRRAE